MTSFDERLLCEICGSRHAEEKKLTTEAALDLITQRQSHFEQNWQRYSDDEMDRALHNLHRLTEHIDVFIGRLREALTMEEPDYESAWERREREQEL